MEKSNRPSCLILVPRAPEFRPLRDAVREGVKKFDVEPVGLDDGVMYGGVVSEAIARISTSIEKADALIVDITGANPNIMYELGFAHALKKQVLPIVKRGDSNIPSDLQGYLYFVYDDMDELENRQLLIHTINKWLYRIFKGEP